MTAESRLFKAKANNELSESVPCAMILAAGFGTRLGKIVKSIPKALVEIGRRPIISKILSEIIDTGINDIIVNAHYHNEVLTKYLSKYPSVRISNEEKLLGTGGGVIKAMHEINNDVLLIVNCDFFTYNIVGEHPFGLLTDRWEVSKADIILLLIKREDARYYYGEGDFSISDEGRLYIREGENEYVFTGAYICSPRFYSGYRTYEYLRMVEVLKHRMMDKTYDIDYIVMNDIGWIDIGTPETLNSARYETEIY